MRAARERLQGPHGRHLCPPRLLQPLPEALHGRLGLPAADRDARTATSCPARPRSPCPPRASVREDPLARIWTESPVLTSVSGGRTGCRIPAGAATGGAGLRRVPLPGVPAHRRRRPHRPGLPLTTWSPGRSRPPTRLAGSADDPLPLGCRPAGLRVGGLAAPGQRSRVERAASSTLLGVSLPLIESWCDLVRGRDARGDGPGQAALEAFAAEMLGGLARSDQRAKGELYLRGLLMDGKRKSMQPMAARWASIISSCSSSSRRRRGIMWRFGSASPGGPMVSSLRGLCHR